MLYHVEDREACLDAVERALRPEGVFCCSTVGDTHMCELHELVKEFDDRIDVPYNSITKGFRLENGEKQLKKFFSRVSCQEQENDLLVDNADVLYDYVYSYPGNAPCILERRGEEFRSMLAERIERQGSIFIHKFTGIFVCRK